MSYLIARLERQGRWQLDLNEMLEIGMFQALHPEQSFEPVTLPTRLRLDRPTSLSQIPLFYLLYYHCLYGCPAELEEHLRQHRELGHASPDWLSAQLDSAAAQAQTRSRWYRRFSVWQDSNYLIRGYPDQREWSQRLDVNPVQVLSGLGNLLLSCFKRIESQSELQTWLNLMEWMPALRQWIMPQLEPLTTTAPLLTPSLRDFARDQLERLAREQTPVPSLQDLIDQADKMDTRTLSHWLMRSDDWPERFRMPFYLAHMFRREVHHRCLDWSESMQRQFLCRLLERAQDSGTFPTLAQQHPILISKLFPRYPLKSLWDQVIEEFWRPNSDLASSMPQDFSAAWSEAWRLEFVESCSQRFYRGQVHLKLERFAGESNPRIFRLWKDLLPKTRHGLGFAFYLILYDPYERGVQRCFSEIEWRSKDGCQALSTWMQRYGRRFNTFYQFFAEQALNADPLSQIQDPENPLAALYARKIIEPFDLARKLANCDSRHWHHTHARALTMLVAVLIRQQALDEARKLHALLASKGCLSEEYESIYLEAYLASEVSR